MIVEARLAHLEGRQAARVGAAVCLWRPLHDDRRTDRYALENCCGRAVPGVPASASLMERHEIEHKRRAGATSLRGYLLPR